ncbi:MAG: hypothetical protein RBT75_02700 [Anaerolineae bacterium]|jgi:hypothetical protein|nr:hypothetical protein [Anaerolineae bacterium]
MSISTTTVLETSARRLFPNQSLEEVLTELLLERAQKNLLKYQVMARQFAAKYEQDFGVFREKVLNSDPDFEVEQDYYDWEMAVTGMEDMKQEIERLRRLHQEL